MISLTKLLIGRYGDTLRYSHDSLQQSYEASKGNGLLVVWNSARSCGLNCIYCYTNTVCGKNPDELLTEEAEVFIDDLADFKVSLLIFSGGEQYEMYTNKYPNSGGEQFERYTNSCHNSNSWYTNYYNILSCVN